MELSIVLVIIGLIVGGILVGRDLIGAAVISGQISQFDKFQVAINTFKEKFGYLPGDIPEPEATKFGFKQRGANQGQGDGNELIEGWANPVPPNITYGQVPWGEAGLFWVDLSTARLIENNFSYADATNTYAIYPTNTVTPLRSVLPQAKIGNDNYIYAYSNNGSNYIGMSSLTPAYGVLDLNVMYSSTGLQVKQAYDIDRKIDDGLPMSGKVTVQFINGRLCYDPTCWLVNGASLTSNISGTSATCMDNGGNGSNPVVYSVSQNNGTGKNCAMSLRF